MEESRGKKIMKVVKTVKRNYLKMHTPEEQSTVRPLNLCQKEDFGLPGAGS